MKTVDEKTKRLAYLEAELAYLEAELAKRGEIKEDKKTGRVSSRHARNQVKKAIAKIRAGDEEKHDIKNNTETSKEKIMKYFSDIRREKPGVAKIALDHVSEAKRRAFQLLDQDNPQGVTVVIHESALNLLFAMAVMAGIEEQRSSEQQHENKDH